MTTTDKTIQTIHGGFKNVPENLLTKRQLAEKGLRPGKEGQVAEVWFNQQWVRLYDVNHALPKRKPSEKQLTALEKAREARFGICGRCGDKWLKQELELMSDDDEQVYCSHCRECLRYEVILRRQEQAFQEATHHLTRVAGVSYENRQDWVSKMDKETVLTAEREPDNPYDANAVKINALIDGKQRHIGYLHEKYAAKFAPKIDAGATLHILNHGVRTEDYGENWETGEEISFLGVQITISAE